MGAIVIVIIFSISCAVLLIGYFLYGSLIEKWMGADPSRPTPAETLNDGMDYCPAPAPVLFGHHFSSIAGAGPIVGPVLAAAAFGWAPTLLWILAGAIFVGGVHDYSAMMASVRHQGRSIGEICRQYLSKTTYYFLLLFIFLALTYVIIVFLDLTAGTMAPSLTNLTEAEKTRKTAEYGAVASASIFYLMLALFFGLAVNRLKLCYKKLSMVFVPLVFFGLWLGFLFPLRSTYFPDIIGGAKNIWIILLLIYCFAASVTPVWILLQPRDYLSSFLLYACLLAGGAGILIAGITGDIAVEYSFFKGFQDKSLGFIFPALFITVACGAVSGFHSIVASGTSAKQLDNEKSIKPVAYGAMIVEGILAVIAVMTVIIVKEIPKGQMPTETFAMGLASFAGSCGLPPELGLTFGLLAINTFLLTTLDTCTRLSRFIFEEIMPVKFVGRRFVSTLACLVLPAVMCFVEINKMPAWKAVWPAFGTTNQLLAALTLLIVAVWLIHCGKNCLYIAVPMLFMLVTAGTSLVQLAYMRLRMHDYIIGVSSLIMLILTVLLIYDSTVFFFRGKIKSNPA